jgi:hemolysin activation/secretion protein
MNGRRWSSGLQMNVETSQDMWGSEFNFSKLEGEYKFTWGRSDNGFSFRLFAGNFWGDAPPLQEKFFTDGANPRERFSKFYLRSVAALPSELHYHFPGGGNLRGYIDQPLATERIVAFNTEFQSALLTPLFRKLLPRRSSVGLVPFFDFARILTVGEEYQNLMDAGIGLRLNLRVFYQRLTVRFDFPVWVSEPLPGEKEGKFRWVFSLQSGI